MGVGLIGGSLALALKKAKFARNIIGVGRSEVNLNIARDLRIVDEIVVNLSDAVAEADLIVLAAPLSATRPLFAELRPILSETTILTDVGSVKGGIVKDAEEQLGASFCRFVPGHPIAGSEAKGAKSAFAELFLNHNVLLTPSQKTDSSAISLVEDMWRAAGARVSFLSHTEHDQNLATTSHLPHILAYVLMNLVQDESGVDKLESMVGGGFRDTTRIASSDPEIWVDIILANREEILSACSQYQTKFTEFISALEVMDGNRILDLIKRAKQARDTLIIPDANNA